MAATKIYNKHKVVRIRIRSDPDDRYTNMAQFRTWKDEFSAYHSASNMRNLTLPCQHAFLLKCLDVSISMHVKRLKTDTTPIFPIPGTNSCFDIISEFFREKNPMMVRRRAFFNYRQAEGQDLSTFRETLRQMADDADIATISLEEILCLCLLYTSPSPRDKRQSRMPSSA